MADLQKNLKLGYRFNDVSLLEEALTHPSVVGDNRAITHYERLEFLGDAVLDMAVSQYLYSNFGKDKEGALAKRRAALVCGETLAMIARQCGIDKALRLGSGEESSGGRENPANLEDALEAVVAAMYLDGGLTPVMAWVERWIAPLAAHMSEPPKDPKTSLQEWAQARKKALPVYKLVEETGPSHAPSFAVSVEVKGYKAAVGTGSSKRVAERVAAENLLKLLRKAE